MGAARDEVLQDRRVHGRPVQVRRLGSPDSGADCHVAFLGDDQLAAARAVWRRRPVLLVGNGAEFAKAGGMIAFVPSNQAVRFQTSAGATRASGVQISSRVMALATRVLDPPREP